MGLGVRTSDSQIKLSMDKLGDILKPIGGVVTAGAGIAILQKGREAIDKLRAKAEAAAAKARGDIPAETRAGVVQLFGGVPMSMVVTLAAVGALAFFVLRKR